MSTIALDSALSGLRAAQRSLDTISNNIANATTPGYTRKILPQEALIVGGIGSGVKLQAIYRNVDKTLLRDLSTQISVSEGYSVQQAFLDRIQDFHGASEDERSVSARIGKLADAFTELSSAPDSALALSSTVSNARQVATTFNDMTSLLTDMRNQTEDEIASALAEVNQAAKLIAQINVDIISLNGQGLSTANLEDQRDLAIQTISKYMEVSTYPAENNKIVVMTKQGQTLADTSAPTLVFQRNNLLPGSYYPSGGVGGIYLNSTSGIEITNSNLGGKIGALLELRDTTIPHYQAQIDEMAQKMAERFDQQGLRLFTDANGNVPPSVADPALVSYVGFAGQIRVNEDIVNDPSLLRSGTYGQTVLDGSNEIIRKISEFTFGTYAYEEARGTTNISAGTIFAATGLTQTNQMNGSVDITDYATLDDATNITAPATFTLTIGATPYNVTINPGDSATDLVNNINATVGSSVASLNGLGQLRFTASADITLTNGTIGAAGLSDLGLSFGTQVAQNPSFTVQVGKQSAVTVTIDPTDTSANILATLNAIPGLSASLNGSGGLVLTPLQGGDLTIANVKGAPIAALGLSVVGVPHTAFRQQNLGPNGGQSSGLLANSSLEEYSRSIITSQSEDASLVTTRAEKETSFLDTLNKRNADTSGVSMDQELSELIRIQTAYTAAARMISASEKMFDELLQAFL